MSEEIKVGTSGLPLAGNAISGISGVFHLPQHVDSLKPNGRYFLPETGYNQSLLPRGLSNFAGTLKALANGKQYLVGDAVVKPYNSKVWEKAQIKSDVTGQIFFVARGQEQPEIFNNPNNISIFQASPEIMFTTNLINKLEEAALGDDIVFIDGTMVLAKHVTKVLYEASTGETVADDAEAVTKAKAAAKFYIFNDRQETVTEFHRISTTAGLVERPARQVMIARK